MAAMQRVVITAAMIMIVPVPTALPSLPLALVSPPPMLAGVGATAGAEVVAGTSVVALCCVVSLSLDDIDGNGDGSNVGTADGVRDGTGVGAGVGAGVGDEDGAVVGASESMVPADALV